MGFLAAVQFFMSLLPLVGQAVDAAEMLFPQKGAGAQKLSHVLSTVQAAAKAAPALVASGQAVVEGVQSGDVDAVTAGLTHLVEYTVKLKNQIGSLSANDMPGG